MKGILKKVGIIFLVILFALMASLFIIAAFFEKQVGQLFLQELNRNLKTELKVKSIELSLLRNFPNASINLKEVLLPGAIKGSGSLLEAKTLSLKFGTMSVFTSKYIIKSIEIEDGALFVYTDKNGKSSTDIVKSTPSSTSSTEDADFQLKLELASLDDIELIYIDEQKGTTVSMRIDKATVAGEFSSQHFAMKSYADIYSGFVENGEDRFMEGTNLAYDAIIDVNLKTGEYKFEKVELAVEENTFKVEGEVNAKEKKTDFNLKLRSEDCSLKSIIALLPANSKEDINDFDSRGTFFLNADIIGELSKYRSPNIDVEFGLKHGKITSPRLDYPIKDVSFLATFKNGAAGQNKDAVFEIKEFEGFLRKEPIKLYLKASDFDNPYIEFTCTANISLAAIYSMLGEDLVTDGDGLIKLNNLAIKGDYKDLIDPNLIYRADASGEIEFEEVMLNVQGKKVYVEEGKLGMQDNNFTVENVHFVGVDNDITLDGTAKNLIPVLLSDSINSKDAKLEFDLALKATNIDFDELFALSPETGEEVVAEPIEEDGEEAPFVEEEVERESFLNFLEGTFSANVDKFNYREIDGEDFNGKVSIENNIVSIQGLKVKAMKGEIRLDGKVYLNEEKPWLESKVYCDQIDATEFFRQCEDFGQEYLTSKNIKGKLDAKILAKAYWDEEGTFLQDKLYTVADLTMSNGELINFDMLEDLSSFVKMKDLERVKFTKTRNQFGILKGKFYIPTMFIQSNALNLSLTGAHAFEGKIDYLVKVNAGQVLWNKFKRFNPNFKPKKAKKKGFLNMYVNVFGTLEDYDYKTSKKQYNATNNKLARPFAKIRDDIEYHFNRKALEEPEELKDDGAQGNAAPSRMDNSPKEEEVLTDGIPDEEYDPELDVEID